MNRTMAFPWLALASSRMMRSRTTACTSPNRNTTTRRATSPPLGVRTTDSVTVDWLVDWLELSLGVVSLWRVTTRSSSTMRHLLFWNRLPACSRPACERPSLRLESLANSLRPGPVRCLQRKHRAVGDHANGADADHEAKQGGDGDASGIMEPQARTAVRARQGE